jgi:hypothetical protein
MASTRLDRGCERRRPVRRTETQGELNRVAWESTFR